MPPSSSRSSSVRALHRVAYKGGNIAHWALFFPDADGGEDGILVHIGALTNASGMKRNHKLYIERYRVTTSQAQSVHVIANAFITRQVLEAVAKSVYERGGYNAITNNCQHFCLDVIQELHRLHPELVSADAVDDVARHGTVITKATRFLRKR